MSSVARPLGICHKSDLRIDTLQEIVPLGFRKMGTFGWLSRPENSLKWRPSLGCFAPPESIRACEPTLLWNQLYSLTLAADSQEWPFGFETRYVRSSIGAGL